ncbi:hypothetical protein ElyMa_000719900 [Elysia marginata]|uniref:Uncharacterized protein n=1 Tax=Elysia marginata TaxID=1093978 RepID=A0AAV4GMB4_9GAST|nr:hypothetical protein ElyMa_000719900 [Elysia marginata]
MKFKEESLQNNQKFVRTGDYNSNVCETTVFQPEICKLPKILQNSKCPLNSSDLGHTEKLGSPETETAEPHTKLACPIVRKLDFQAPTLSPQSQIINNSSQRPFPVQETPKATLRTDWPSNRNAIETDAKTCLANMSFSQRLVRFSSGIVETFQAVLLVFVGTAYGIRNEDTGKPVASCWL